MDKWLNNVMAIRVIALAIAILMWLVVHIDQDTATVDRNVNVPVTKERMITNVAVRTTGLDDSKFHVASMEPTTVNVVLRGREEDINTISTTDGNSQIIADLSNVNVGSNTIYLEHRGYPNGVDVSIQPNSVAVTVEEIQEKEMQVSVQTTGEPAEGFKPGTPIVTPNRIHIAGPISELERVDRVVAPVDVTDARETVQDDVKLAALDTNGEPVSVRINPAVVNVEVPITSPFKTVPLQVKLTGQTPAGYSVSSFAQSVSEVTIYAPEAVLDRIDFYEGTVLNLGELTESRTVTIPIPLRNGVERVMPETVEVRFEVVASAERTIEGVPITFIGATEGTTVSFAEASPRTIDVVVEAAPAVLDDLNADDIQAFVDVSNLPAGEHTLPVKLSLPMFVKTAGNQSFTGTVVIAPQDEPADAETAAPTPTPTPVPTPAGTPTPTPDSVSGTGEAEASPAEAQRLSGHRLGGNHVQ